MMIVKTMVIFVPVYLPPTEVRGLRDLCEVEFWEVFFMEGAKVF